MLEIENFVKYYDELLAVNDLSFKLKEGEFGTLLGPSGCGKSTTLHSIAGLREPTEGTIRLRGEDVTEQSPDERNIGMVFQNSATFPHMTVEENVRYGLKMHGYDDEKIEKQISKYLGLVQIDEYRDHRPGELSGGQERRVSIARALAYEPDILLLDEPLTGLDRVLRQELRNEIKEIQQKVNVTTLYVTHDQEEALAMSDKIIVLDNGEKQQEGGPKEIYDNPTNNFVASFVGKSTHLSGELSVSNSPTVNTAVGDVPISDSDIHRFESGEELDLFIRPEDVELADPKEANSTALHGTVRSVEYLGTLSEVIVDIGKDVEAVVHTSTSESIETDEDVSLDFDPKNVISLKS